MRKVETGDSTHHARPPIQMAEPLIDQHRQWFKAHKGVAATEQRRGDSRARLSTVCFSVRGADVGIAAPAQTHASLQEHHTLKIYV